MNANQKMILALGILIIIPFGVNAGFWDKVKKTVKKTYKAVEDTATKTKKATEKRLKDIGDQVSTSGGAVVDAGVKIGNVTVKKLDEAGKVTLEVASKATGGVSTIVLEAGESMVNAAGMTLLNTGGIIWALSQGDLSQFTDCAQALYSGAKLGVATAVDTALKAVGSIDKIIEIKSCSIDAAVLDIINQAKTPKMSIAGKFLGNNFKFTDVQIDLSDPEALVAGIIEKLISSKDEQIAGDKNAQDVTKYVAKKAKNVF